MDGHLEFAQALAPLQKSIKMAEANCLEIGNSIWANLNLRLYDLSYQECIACKRSSKKVLSSV